MRFKNNQDFDAGDDTEAGWVDFVPSFAWSLSSREGTQTVFAQFRDAVGNVSDTPIRDQIIFDATPPVGSVTIQSKLTNTRRITLNLSAADALSDMAATGQVRLRNDDDSFTDDEEGWQPFRSVIVWTLSAGRGTKTVFAQFRDAAGNLSGIRQDATVLDDQPPQVVSVRPREGAIHEPINTSIIIAFGENLDIRNLSSSMLTVSGDQSGNHRGFLTARGTQIDFVTDRIFTELETVTIILQAGVRDEAGNATTETFQSRFSTGAGVWPGDTNNDGRVDPLDIVPIGRYWEQTGPPRDSRLIEEEATAWAAHPAVPFGALPATYADADGNGVVAADDAIPIALNWNRSREEASAGPRIEKPANQLTHRAADTEVERWLAIYQAIHVKLLALPTKLEGVVALRKVIEAQIAQLESRLFPGETRLLPNYPNPFNPETWLPYQLAEAGKVTIEIYDPRGHLVRTLNVGHRRRGYYLEKGKAAHWDGRNLLGESVASGVYLYLLHVGNFSETRRLVIAK